MIKKLVRDFLILFGLLILWLSTSRQAMQYYCDLRDVDKWWGTYRCNHGDLVSMSYLDFMKKFNPGKDNTHTKKPSIPAKNQIELYLDGDSYTWHMHDTMFAGLTGLHYIDRNHGLNYHLDTTKNNVFIIELSERFVRDYFSTLKMLDEVCDSVIQKKKIAGVNELMSVENFSTAYSASFVLKIGLDDFFNRYINQNLQCNLFNYQAIVPLFQSKAVINYYVFNRASGDVVISNDRQFLFLKETVSKTDVGSSYVALEHEDIEKLVYNLNELYDHYKKTGFKEVYISLIPNSATIMQPDGYNNLIPMIQNHPRLRMKVINVYDAFKKSDEVLYLSGDTHWNLKGRQKWLDIVNGVLQQ